MLRDDAAVPGPDTDGDGKTDEIATEGDAVVFTRGDGRIRFESKVGPVQFRVAADFDGDGRDDVILTLSGADDGAYVVSGTVTPGTRAPEQVGVRIRPELAFPWQGLTGKRGADFAVVLRAQQGSTTEVYEGQAVLALGPGSDGRNLKPTVVLTGLPRVRMALTDQGEPETLLYVPGSPAEVRFASRPRAVYRALGRSSRVEDVFVFTEDGKRKIGLRIDDQLAVWPIPPTCR